MSSQIGHDPIELNSNERAFIESCGLHFEKSCSVSRISGRILGLLLLTPFPVTMGEIGQVFAYSHGSLSSNLRFLCLVGLVERVTLPGERCDYYRFSDQAWSEILRKRADGIRELRGLAAEALGGLELQNPVRQRFTEIAAWADLLQDAYRQLMDVWASQRLQSSDGQTDNLDRPGKGGAGKNQ